MQRTQSQSAQILAYMQTHADGITPIDALNLCGCLRLSARIADLKADGHVIENRPKPGEQYARYYLEAEA